MFVWHKYAFVCVTVCEYENGTVFVFVAVDADVDAYVRGEYQNAQ